MYMTECSETASTYKSRRDKDSRESYYIFAIEVLALEKIHTFNYDLREMVEAGKNVSIKRKNESKRYKTSQQSAFQKTL